MDDLIDVWDLLGSPHFTTGLRFGLVALAIGWTLRLLLGPGRRPLPIAGILIAVAMLFSLSRVEESVIAELPALGAILAGAMLVRIPRVPTWTQPILVLPGAVWFALSTSVTMLPGIRTLLIVLIPLAGFAINDFERRHTGMGLGVVFYTIAVLGMFAAVPDTEWAVALVAVSISITFLAWPGVAASLGPEGAYLAVAVFLWVAAQGGEARPPSIVGSAACLGLLVIEPVVLAFKPTAVKLTTWFNHTPAGAVLASLPHFLVMVVCSRVAARFTTFLPAILVVIGVYALALVTGFWAPERLIEAEEEEPADELLPPDFI
ncbi:MAG TPA: hypothetical protein VLA91_00010 [Acidimicrobiia bacterium]|nr:hypothetical protein [Acidimicrobiia bacterium]